MRHKHTPLPTGAPQVGNRATLPHVHALNLAERGFVSGPIDAAGRFLAEPTRHLTKINEHASKFPEANWAAPAGVEFGFVVLDVGVFADPLPHEFGALNSTWTIIRTDGGGIHLWYRIDGVAAEPNGRLLGIATIKPLGILPGSKHTNGSGYVFADDHGPGEIGLAKLSPNWLWAFPRRNGISAATSGSSSINPQPTTKANLGGWMS